MEDEAYEILREFVKDVDNAYPDGVGLEDDEDDEGFWPDLATTYYKAKAFLSALDEMRR